MLLALTQAKICSFNAEPVPWGRISVTACTGKDVPAKLADLPRIIRNFDWFD
jgi:hypothetical protein